MEHAITHEGPDGRYRMVATIVLRSRAAAERALADWWPSQARRAEGKPEVRELAEPGTTAAHERLREIARRALKARGTAGEGEAFEALGTVLEQDEDGNGDGDGTEPETGLQEREGVTLELRSARE